MASIRLRNVCLDYPLYGASDFSIRRRLFAWLTRRSSPIRTLRAIDDVSIEAADGARIGLLGPNGSGKSTLLRLIAGVYPPTSGRVEIAGAITPLLGLDADVNMDFMAADNISLLLRISGRIPTPAIVDEIWAFTGLEERMRCVPLLRTFSSGMLMRVLFATATAFPADILLLDEWLSVADENFSARAEDRLLKLVSMAATMVVASHNQALLRRCCTKIVNLDHGRIVSTVAHNTQAAQQPDVREERHG
jgi:lipopolysaccharide transport system ATP-binding protein